jgi:hypothetical protein
MRNLALWTATVGLLLGALPVRADLTIEQRAAILRELTAEYGTAKILIPRSKKPLPVSPKGVVEEEMVWAAALEKFGPAARLGDLAQITKVEFKKDQLVLTLNHGISGGRKWWHRVQVSGTSQMSTLGQGQQTYAPGGTTIALVFENEIPAKTADEFKQMLKPILDFEQRSATELYLEKLPQKFQDAIEQKRVVPEMDRDMVLLAKGRPDRRVRDFKNGVESEDWIYGTPPGNIVFITFEDGKVTSVKDTYANVGGEVRKAEPAEQQQP